MAAFSARKVESAFVGAKGFDCVTQITADTAKRMVESEGMDFAVRYLGSLPPEETQVILDAGLAIMPVTYGLKHGHVPSAAFGSDYGAQSAKRAADAGLVSGVTIWLDLEDCAGTPDDIIAFVNAWSTEVINAGCVPGLYVGFGTMLTSQELYALKSARYWHSLSRVTDRNGLLAEPTCGWCMHQLYPTTSAGEIPVDVNFIQQDYRGRLPTWVRKV
jgi:hypothetical protein